MVHPPWYYVGFGRLTLYLKVEPLALFNLHQYTGAAARVEKRAVDFGEIKFID